MKIRYIDMDDVLVDFASAFPRVDGHTLRAYDGALDEVPHIFPLMEPMPGARAAFTGLAGVFETDILPTGPRGNPTAGHDKMCRVQRHLGTRACKRPIRTHHKALDRGQFPVDDRDRNGAGESGGEPVRFGSQEFPDWPSVCACLLPRR